MYGTFTVDLRTSAGAAHYQRRWQEVIGDRFPLPHLSAATTAGLSGRFGATLLHDVVISEVDSRTATGTAGRPRTENDAVRLWIVHRGRWDLGGARDGSEHAVRSGSFLLGHAAALPHFATRPGTTARVLVLPSAPLAPLIRGHRPTGPATAAEVRLLVAHATMVRRTLPHLGPDGLRAAHDALLELVSALARGRTATGDDFAPALVRAAKDLAERRLADPGLSPAALARALHVSTRTLQRAFAADGGSVTAHVRERRLLMARRSLAESGLSVSEAAARWCFADASHLSRAFKRRFGLSPSDFRRLAAGQPRGVDDVRPRLT